MSGSTTSGVPPAWLLEPDTPRVQVWGLTPSERLIRSLRAAGCTDVRRAGVEGPTAPPKDGDVLLFRADAIYDERLIRGLVEARDTVLIVPDPAGGSGVLPVAASVDASRVPETLFALSGSSDIAPRIVPPDLHAATPQQLVPSYTAALRKREAPYLFVAPQPGDAAAIEDATFAASYKGLTDLVTRWVWPRPAAAVVRVLARHGVQPNAVTAASWLLAAAALVLFYRGDFAAGLVAAWSMTFLDTVDGKLARCTLTSSSFGHVFDHALDLLHPPFWWLAWGLALAPGHELATAFVVAAYLAGRAVEGLFLLAFRFEIHSWRPVDGLFRTITARRNPNLLLLSVGTLAGRPDLGLVMVAGWSAVSLAFHTVRIAQAFRLRGRGGNVEPWDEDRRTGERPIVGRGVDASSGPPGDHGRTS